MRWTARRSRVTIALLLVAILVGASAFWARVAKEVIIEGMIGWSAADVRRALGEPAVRFHNRADLNRFLHGGASDRDVVGEAFVYHYGFRDIAVIYVDDAKCVTGVYLVR